MRLSILVLGRSASLQPPDKCMKIGSAGECSASNDCHGLVASIQFCVLLFMHGADQCLMMTSNNSQRNMVEQRLILESLPLEYSYVECP